MKRRILVALALLAPSARAQERVPPPAPPSEPSERQNLVLFLVDDLGWQDTSVSFGAPKSAANDHYRTPNLERLAARGMRFTNAYASAPVCTPTRTSILTGMSPARSRITFWTFDPENPPGSPYRGVAPPSWNARGLSRDDVTLPKLLKAAGYRTIHVGKAHFGASGTSGSDPTRLGFDENVAGHAAGSPASYLGLDSFSLAGRAKKLERKSIWDVPGLEAYHGKDVFLEEALALEAASRVREAVRLAQPFYLSFAPYAVHTPIQANPRYLGRYLEGHPDLDPIERAYATMVETVDAALGTLLDLLDELGVAERTVIVFSSDNGGLTTHDRGGTPLTHNAPLRSGKGSACEGGLRVPTIVVWPGVVAAGSVSDVPIVSHDFFPTLLSIAGATIPSEHAARVDGADLSPILRGKKDAGLARPLVWHQPHYWGKEGPGLGPFSAIRSGPWKLIYYHADRRFELFDLEHDLGETRDLSSSEPKRVLELATELDAVLAQVGAQLSIDVETKKPIEGPASAARR